MEPPIHKPLLLGEATRRLQGWRCDLLKGDMSKSDPKRSKVLLRCSLKLIWSWDYSNILWNFPPPTQIRRLQKKPCFDTCANFPLVSTSSGRPVVPFPAPGLRRSMSGDSKFCTAASSSLEQLAVTKTSQRSIDKKNMSGSHWNLEFVFLTNIPKQQKSEMIKEQWEKRTADRLIVYKIRSWMRSTVLWYADSDLAWYKEVDSRGPSHVFDLRFLPVTLAPVNEASSRNRSDLDPMCWSWKITTGKKPKVYF